MDELGADAPLNKRARPAVGKTSVAGNRSAAEDNHRPMSVDRSLPDNAGSTNLRLVFLLNLGFTLLELVGGVWPNSLAIISGAVHDLGDSFSLGLAWYLDKYAEKGRDRRYSVAFHYLAPWHPPSLLRRALSSSLRRLFPGS
jgi:hypothetical protein